MVRLRLQKVGRPKTPHFRIVAIDSRKARDAAGLEVLGPFIWPKLLHASLVTRASRISSKFTVATYTKTAPSAPNCR
jgi:ribosomal protein S16